MGLDYGALNEAQEELVNRGSDGIFVYGKDIKKETDIRILPPYPELKGKYYLEVIVFWINKKKYISPLTFGEPCPINELYEQAKNGRDKELKNLVEDREIFQKKYEYLMPILLLDVTLNKNNELTGVKVKDGKAKVLSVGPMAMKRINKVACSRKYMNGTPDGFTDREKGYNFILSKTGEGLNTEYDCEGDVQWEMDEKYYKDYPNVVDLVQDEMYDADYLEAVMRNFLYGEPMPVDPKERKDDAQESRGRSEAPARGRAAKEEEKPARGRAAKEEEKPAARRSTVKEEPKEEKPAGRRNILKDLESLD